MKDELKRVVTILDEYRDESLHQGLEGFGDLKDEQFKAVLADAIEYLQAVWAEERHLD